MLLTTKIVVVLTVAIMAHVNYVASASAKSGKAALLQMAQELGAPFAKTAAERLHGNIFGKGRAARSTDVVIFNKSNKSFTLTSSSCDHGGYSTNLFPLNKIKQKESTVFGMESHGLATGVECTTKYTSADGTFFQVTANNPYIGNNSLRQSSSPSLKLVSTLGQGDNNQVRWIVDNK